MAISWDSSLLYMISKGWKRRVTLLGSMLSDAATKLQSWIGQFMRNDLKTEYLLGRHLFQML